jgi:hypothetical protein
MREHEPIGAWLRSSRSQRRVGPGAICASCGKESRPYALIFGRDPPCCYRCDRIAQGHLPYEDNHVFGKRNSDLMIRYPINDHRAVFNVKQLDWTPETLENVNGDPLLEAMARFHGLDDNVVHMLADCIAFVPKIKHVQELLVAIYGPDWLPGLEAAAKHASGKPVAKEPRVRRTSRVVLPAKGD